MSLSLRLHLMLRLRLRLQLRLQLRLRLDPMPPNTDMLIIHIIYIHISIFFGQEETIFVNPVVEIKDRGSLIMPPPAKVFLHYGPYDSCATVEHRTHRLDGLLSNYTTAPRTVLGSELDVNAANRRNPANIDRISTILRITPSSQPYVAS